jgi:SAM-dependent methyltransferase
MAAKTRAKRKNSEANVRPEAPSEDEIRKAVRENYAKLALTSAPCCGTAQSNSCGCGGIYSSAEVMSLPQEAVAVSAGCGNPTAIASMKPGMVAVDFGSGGGIDVFLSARKVGPKGKVFGIDATPEMILRARKTARENSIDNVEFRLGEIEHVPLEANVADVVISNCVINLSPDKEQVFREAFRILKPGGKLAVSDIILLKDLPEDIRKDLSSWSVCVSGAISEEEYIGAMKRAGFEKVKVEDQVVYKHEQLADYLKDTKLSDDPRLEHVDLANLIASYKISAVKPKTR